MANRYTKRNSKSVPIREMQIKTISYPLIPVKIAIIKRKEITSVCDIMEKREYLYTIGRKVNWHSHYENMESILPGEISIISDMHMTLPLWQKVKRN